MSLIEVKNLCHVYGAGTSFEKSAVDDVSFEIEKGEIIGIIGHTGSGKSTLLSHLNGLLKPTSGQILYNGKDIWAEPKEIRKLRFKVGLVFQYPEYQLFDETVFKDISFGPGNMGLSEEEIKERVLESADLLHVKREYLEKSPFDLSGGEKRRVAIAGIIAMQPEVLVLDEPTAGLDPKGSARIRELILDYRDKTNSAVVFVSHSMETVAGIAQKVLVMNKGKAAIFDKTEEVFKQIELLKSFNLDVPEVTEIFLELKKRGYDVRTDVFTVEQAKAEIARLRGEKSV